MSPHRWSAEVKLQSTVDLEVGWEGRSNLDKRKGRVGSGQSCRPPLRTTHLWLLIQADRFNQIMIDTIRIWFWLKHKALSIRIGRIRIELYQILIHFLRFRIQYLRCYSVNGDCDRSRERWNDVTGDSISGGFWHLRVPFGQPGGMVRRSSAVECRFRSAERDSKKPPGRPKSGRQRRKHATVQHTE